MIVGPVAGSSFGSWFCVTSTGAFSGATWLTPAAVTVAREVCVPSSRLVKAAKSSCTACVPVAPLQALAGASQRATVAAFSPSPPLDVERRGSPTEDDAPPNVNFDVPGTGKNPLGSRTSTRKSEVVPHASAKVTW